MAWPWRGLCYIAAWTIALATGALASHNNPVVPANSPDPYVVRSGNNYYFLRTTATGVEIRQCAGLESLAGGTTVTVFQAPAGPILSDVWAPELHYFDGRWYVYACGTITAGQYNHRMFVLESDSADPLGSYTYKGLLLPDTHAIDATVLVRPSDGARFVVFSGYDSAGQSLYIAPLSNPWTASANPVRISQPTLSWETVGSPVNEGPAVLQRGGKTFIVYSASGTWTPDYCLGMLTNTSGDYLNPAAWTKNPQPVFQRWDANGVYCVGHNSFTTSPSGAEDWIVYHATADPTGDQSSKRSTRIQRFDWNPDDTPRFGVPVPGGFSLAGPDEADSQPSLQALYKFEGNAADNSGFARNGSFTGGTSIVTGKLDASAVQFNGSTGYALIPRSIENDYTISLWVKTTDTGGTGQWYAGKGLIDGDMPGAANDFGVSLTGGKAAFGVGNPDTTVLSTTSVNDGAWHHVLVTRNATSGAMRLHVDGNLEASAAGPTGLRAAANVLRVGAILTSGSSSFLNGAIDEVRLYNRVLASAEISALSKGQLGAALVAHYAFDGNALDDAGLANDGSAIAINYVSGRVGTLAAQFNGTSSHVRIPCPVSAGFTLALWLKSSVPAGSGQWWAGNGLLDGEVAGAAADFGLALVGSRAAFGVGSNDTTLVSSTAVADGTWHHVAATRDGSGGAMRIYVDGVLEGSQTGPTATRNAPQALHIGNLQTGINHFTGLIDDVRIYDGVLSAGEIAAVVAAAGPPPVQQPPPPWQAKTGPLTTPWTATVSPANALPDYPRPQMTRTEWQNLNGEWQFGVDHSSGATPPIGQNLAESVLVPFPVESPLSGIMRRESRMWYRRTFTVPTGWSGRRVMLNFGAVDWQAAVYVNGISVGSHAGGYDGFAFDITNQLNGGTNELIVGVYDPSDGDGVGQPVGKQRGSPGGIWYSSASGIWQTVWLEPVAAAHIARFEIAPDIDAGVVRVMVVGEGTTGKSVRAVVSSGGVEIGSGTGVPGDTLAIAVPGARLWSPDDPFLYDLTVSLADGITQVDRVGGYFGMRKISLGMAGGVLRPMLNNAFVFQLGMLDQGYWPDGIYTAPCDAALRFDLEQQKSLGCNVVRKHTKVESARWYYWADKLGLLVWQDMPAMAAAPGAAAQVQFETELRRLIDDHRNSPAIIMWVPFNEGWGQYDTARISGLVKGWDPSRLVNNASGWTDAGVGDVVDWHVYLGPASPAPSITRAAVLGEFGGLGLKVAGHEWNAAGSFGYEMEPDAATLTSRYVGLVYDARSLMASAGLSAAIYTEINDQEIEVNGLLTYDRRVTKPDVASVRAAHTGLIAASRMLDAPLVREACWRLDENTGTVATDASGNGNDAELVNAPSRVAGVAGGALACNGTNSYAMAGRSVLDAGANYSVAAWVRLDSTSNWATAVSQDGVNVSGFFLQYALVENRFAFSVPDSDTTSAATTRVTASAPPVTGAWVHLVGVHDASNSQLRLYVNGALAGAVPCATAWKAAGNTVIGRGRWGGATDFFPGAIDDVRVMNRALAADEIAWIYHYPGGPLPIAGGSIGDADGDSLPDAWESAHGLGIFDSHGNNGPQGDPDHDGMVNLLEYALNLDPQAWDATGRPVATIETRPADGLHYLTLRYRRLLIPGKLRYVPEVSNDLADWRSTPADLEEVPPATPDSGGLTETVTVRIKPAVSAAGGSRIYARLRVTSE